MDRNKSLGHRFPNGNVMAKVFSFYGIISGLAFDVAQLCLFICFNINKCISHSKEKNLVHPVSGIWPNGIK